MQTLECGIEQEIRNAMAYQDTPDNETLESYVGRLKRMDERLRRIRGQPKGQPIIPQIPRNQVMPTSVDHGSPAVRAAVRLGAP